MPESKGLEPVIVSRTIAAPADKLWAMVSDITRMGEWSPETTGGAWVKRAKGPSVGARFKGKNRNGPKTWSIVCEVTESVPGKVFAFDAMAMGVRYANWRYDFEPVGDAAAPGGNASTLVTESVIDNRGHLFKWAGAKMSGVTDRVSHNERTMTETLEALAVAAES
ncbi:MAG: SRPBCC family protein [Acidimicrobiales bacterium]|nr:SRPBCC family protein [Acidimicrobiales bacterium]